MNITHDYSSAMDVYIQSIINQLKEKYSDVGVNRFQYKVKFFYAGKCKTVDKSTLEDCMNAGELPLTISRLLK